MPLINLFVAARRAVADWRRRQRAYHELMALDDRSLADIGIRRSQIPAIVAGVEMPGDAAERPARQPAVTVHRIREGGRHRRLPTPVTERSTKVDHPSTTRRRSSASR